jgi:hypothetical protein
VRYFYDLAVDRTGSFSEEPVVNKKIIAVEFLEYRDGRLPSHCEPNVQKAQGETHVVILGGENDHFVKLGNIGQEIIYSRSFCCSPTVLAL